MNLEAQLQPGACGADFRGSCLWGHVLVEFIRVSLDRGQSPIVRQLSYDMCPRPAILFFRFADESQERHLTVRVFDPRTT